MVKNDLKKIKIPNKTGVYFFLGRKKEILYIGKATTLSHRVYSYFDGAIREKRSPLIEKMIIEAKKIDWIVTDSVLEAMLLETNLIRTHKPVYNTRSKDDKSYNHVVITNDAYPRVLVIRGKDLATETADDRYTHIYGPFPNNSLFKEALKIVRKLFQFYDTDKPIDAQKSKLSMGKLDFNRQIGLYPNACNKEVYMQTIRHMRLFFEGKKKEIIDELEREMNIYAKQEKFEEANYAKKKIFALRHIQDISLLKDEMRLYKDDRNIRIEAYDVAHLSGSSMVGVMVVLEGDVPKKSEYRKFNIKKFTQSNDPGALRELVERRLRHPEWKYPDVVVVDGNSIQKNIAEKEFKKSNIIVHIVGVVKNEKHQPKQIIGSKKIINYNKQAILLANMEAHRFAIQFHREKRAKSFLIKS